MLLFVVIMDLSWRGVVGDEVLHFLTLHDKYVCTSNSADTLSSANTSFNNSYYLFFLQISTSSIF